MKLFYISAAIILSALLLLSSCMPSGNATDNQEDNRNLNNPFVRELDIDPETGVQYFIPENYVEEHELPDGSTIPLVHIPGGSFLMGLNNADPFGIQPSGKARISVNSFMLGQTEVTNQQYRAFLESLSGDERTAMQPDSAAWTNEIGVPWGSYFRGEEFQEYPVVAVTWDQAKAFAEWAGLRLPAESEWEYAARSGVSGRIFPWDGLDIRSRHNGEILANFAPGGDYAQDGFVITAPTGSFPANNFRLYDMAGNVAEWCEDAYAPSYSTLTRAQSQLVTPVYRNENETRRIVRGGSWASNEFWIGVGVRDFRHRSHASPRIGFRVASSVSNPAMLMRDRAEMNSPSQVRTN